MGFIGTRSISKQPFTFNGSYVWKKTTMEGEAPHKKAKRDVERTDFIYKNAVKTVETTRCNIECEMYTYLVKIEDIEYQRIQTIRSAVAAMIDLESKSVMVNQVLYNHDKLYLETIQPERDLIQVINQCRTGTTHIPVSIYESFYYSPGKLKLKINCCYNNIIIIYNMYLLLIKLLNYKIMLFFFFFFFYIFTIVIIIIFIIIISHRTLPNFWCLA